MNQSPKAALPLPTVPARRADAHKGDFGRVLIVAGSRGMVGAACLATLAALRSGAGLVALAIPESAQRVAAGRVLSAVTIPLPETASGSLAAGALDPLRAALATHTHLLIGPGLTADPETAQVVHSLLTTHARIPTVIDADALNILGVIESDVSAYLGARKFPAILTPHPGEAARMLRQTSADIQRDRVFAAGRLVGGAANVTVVLKGAGTIIADKNRAVVNATGNPGMATGGSGDVLAGCILGLWAQRLTPFDAARLGVHAHGRAGDLAAARLGQLSLTAEDVLDDLPTALHEHASGSA